MSGADIRIELVTDLGEIILALYPDQAPLTVANFVRYVDEERYREATFYRTVRRDNDRNPEHPIEVIQGGLDWRGPLLPPVVHETTQKTGLRHLDGAISMARTALDTACSEFFICIGANPHLDCGAGRNADKQGFATFGRVLTGMDVVRRINIGCSNAPTQEPYVRGQILDEPVAIRRARRLSR